jgi:hypothetical protein
MMQSEFEKLIGDRCYEYNTVEFVYSWHPSINNTDGKKQISETYQRGGISAIKKMVPESIIAARKNGIDIQHVVEKLSEYDVVCGYCYNIMGTPWSRLFSDLANKMGEYAPNEYFHLQRDFENRNIDYNSRIAVYCCPGGSEGVYLYIDELDQNGKRNTVILGKSFDSLENLYQAAAICAKYLQYDY